MKLTVTSVVVFASVLTAKHVTGQQARTSIDCMDPGIEGQKTELKCRITGTVRSGIIWIAPRNKEAVICNYLQTICETSGEFRGHYTGVIDSPQQNTLVIESFDPKTDTGAWSCSDGSSGRRSLCVKIDPTFFPAMMGTSGTCVHAASTSMVVFWIVAILVATLQTTTSMSFT
ncbi:uncharacterized protein LOC121388309 [Gigantopelta aegis]|uniref:uncharacterized protein LOC121388309 n=1 Tax=Gigantopelta aegis TaxID=1735272 RepID=UPI001B88854E|nr:uncharacterized protein LOC121388309 [Gigantopelta aegis]